MNNNQWEVDELAILFKKYNALDFLFVEPGGNFGDHLIYWGAEFLAQQLGISFRTLSIQEFLAHQAVSGEVVYIHGGGGYNRWCSGAVIQALEHALRSEATSVIQGPCTLEEDRDYIREVMIPILHRHTDRSFYFLARELTSYHLALELLRPFCHQILISHDTAFRLTKQEILRTVGEVSRGYQLYGFRLDNESGEKSFAVNKMGVRMDPAYFCRDFLHWVRVHAGAKKIITNRTHSSILGSILEIDTTLFPSRYHKNRSVWEYSLKFRGVTWSDGVVTNEILTRNDFLDYLPGFLRRSYKVERIVRFCQGVPLK
ncbi:hypothetical protein ASE11_11590 [Hydrogenophaga sp. Root209]|uniref:polysaccharide pyruvyl transferase family protein n=1 Tax=Hydrogenophaga sp. Root209 TaxID=1736490 RepID=UPI0006F23190|nr:polysaccharide pyruvyl transferase family protein [Hydrogenophaga sp. Root209]KRB98957.1 hypothetical protein ASE11_11590 [Hydrogenophaga sp. Root209]